MKKVILTFILLFSVTLLNAHEIHKFYVSIFLIENNSKYNELEITARIFIDDLEKALETKFNIKSKIGAKNQLPNLDKYIETYINSTISFTTSTSQKPLKWLGYEIENDVIICYFVTPFIKTDEKIIIKNSFLTEIYSAQQNIMHFTINDKKSSILLTKYKIKETLSL